MKNIFGLTSLLFFLIFTECGKKNTPSPPAPSSATLTTSTVANIASTTAIGGGNITSDGGAAISARGICWNTTGNPNSANSKTTDGSSTGNFVSSITGLTPATTYFVRAYATNSVGTAYGNEISFTTLPPPATLPIVSTNAISGITNTTAISGGNVTSDGGASITARGVCYGTTNNPTISGTKTTDGTGAGIFTSNINGLTLGTTYFVRAYATNSAGTAYGSEMSFITTGYYVGQQGYGGVVFWASSDANKALVAAKRDIQEGTPKVWWPQGGPYTWIGAANNELGGGDFNTTLIATHPQCQPTAAARLAYDAVIEGYSDWYLPNGTEMHSLIMQRTLPGLAGTFVAVYDPFWRRYWCSNEYHQSQPLLTYVQSISNSTPATDSKNSGGGVRSIRKIGNW